MSESSKAGVHAGPLARIIATGAGAGFSPIAPGTAGSLEGVVVFLLCVAFVDDVSVRLLILLTLNIVVAAAGVWASTQFCRAERLADPGEIVVDEISGQLIALTPLALSPSIAGVALSVVLFRSLDIFKPFPINRLERLHEGWGIMADDVAAGLLAGALVWMALLAGVL